MFHDIEAPGRALVKKATLPAAMPSPAATVLLRLVHAERFLQRLLADRPSKRRSPGLAGCLARVGIGTIRDSDPAFVHYGSEHFQMAEQLLISNGRPTALPQPKKPVIASKAKTKAPLRSDVVAATWLNTEVPSLAGVRFVAIGIHDALRVHHDVLLLCESITALHRLQEFTWLDRYVRGRRALAFYAGGSGGFRVEASMELATSSGAPILALVDSMPAGLALACRQPNLEAICLPPWELLRPMIELGEPSRYFSREMSVHAATLQRLLPPDAEMVLRHIRLHQCGVKVENYPRGKVELPSSGSPASPSPHPLRKA